MKTKREFYQVKIKIYYESYNQMRGIETNDFETAEKKFCEMEKLAKQFENEWILQLNKCYKNSVVPIKIRSSSGIKADSPLV